MNEMGGACGTCRGEVQRILVGKLEEKGHLNDLAVDGSAILKWILRNQLGRRGYD
jgi:ferredoxin